MSSLRSRLLFLVLLSVLPATGLVALNSFWERAQAIEQTRGRAVGLAQLTAANVTGVIEAAEQAVVAVARLPQAQTPGGPGCDATFMQLGRFFPRYASLGLSLVDGQVVCSSTPRPGSVDVKDRAWFQEALQRRSFAIGDYQVGRITGLPAINVAQPVEGPDGTLVAVVYVAIPTTELSHQLGKVPLPADGAVLILDRAGTIVTRQPQPELWEGKQFSDGAVLDAMRGPAGGVLRGRGVDDREREYAFSPLERTAGAMWVVLGMSVADLEADANHTLLLSLGGLLALTLLVLAAGWAGAERLVLRPVSSLVATARRLGAGDLNARTDAAASAGVAEIRELGGALDSMAVTLASQMRRIELILDSAGEGICGLDQDARVTFVNPAATAMLGYEVDELVGHHFHRLVHHTRADGTPFPAEECPVVHVLRGRKTAQHIQDIFWRKNQTSFPVEYTATPLVDHGVSAGAVLVFSDITERRQAETDRAQRLASQREAQVKDELVSVVSHELRTPLAAIVGFTELLLTREWPEIQRREFLETMLRESRRLTALINDFLDLQRIESGQMEFTPRDVDLRPLLAEAVTSAGADADRPIVLDVPHTLPLVRADPDRLQQVLLNLLSNARKYSPGGGEIRIRARAIADETVEVAVQDQGLGLPPDALPRLFERFYRVETGDRREIKGTGLGLAICKELIQAQGGQLRVESDGPGEGSTFTFTLPAARAARTLPLHPNEGSRGAAGQRLLVVEDDPAMGRWLAETLTLEGYDVEVATSAEEGLASIEAERPAAVLLNINLHGTFDGWDLLAILRGRADTASLPVVVVSGREEYARGRALGVADYLVKPVPLETLRAAVRQLGVGRGQTVLVAEDDDATRAATVAALESAGFHAEPAASGEAALRLLQAHPVGYGLLLLDLGLPGIDGFGVLEAVRANPATTDLPVLVLTGREISDQERQYLGERVVEVLRKGDELGVPVVEAVARALARVVPELERQSPEQPEETRPQEPTPGGPLGR